MDIELRWILIVISILVLVLIVFDGWRRIKRQQKSVNKSESLMPDLSAQEEDNLLDPMEEVQMVKVKNDLPNESYESTLDDNIEQLTPIIADMQESVTMKKTSVVIDDTIDTMSNSIFVIHVLAPKGTAFSGSQLLPALLSLGLRYGEMSIFHRHEHINGNGAILFSLASATEPGIFNLDSMESQYFPGLTLFLQIPGPTHPTNALNLMIQTAKRLAKALDGSIYDDERQPLTENNLDRRYYFRLRQILGKI